VQERLHLTGGEAVLFLLWSALTELFRPGGT
jgi:hypothetical protein